MASNILPITNNHQSPNHQTSTSTMNPEMMMMTTIDDPSVRLLASSPLQNEISIPIRPLLPRTVSFAGTATPSTATTSPNCYQQRRRRIASESCLLSFSDTSGRPQSFSRHAGYAAEDTFLITGLTLKLLRCLGVGYRWIVRFLALGSYSLMLLPGLTQVGYYYFFSKQVLRGIVYGDQPRNRLDLYLPKNSEGPKPVVAFVTGGAWIIGNFPQGTMSDMVKDASQGISFVCNNIAQYGGDPKRIYLMGQSAGAHIAACALVEQAIKEAGKGEGLTWRVSQINAFFGLSGGYNLFDLVGYFHSRGLYRSIFLSIMEGEESLRQFSPEVIVQEPNLKNAVALLPPIILFHGTADYSIPVDASKNFAETLQRVGVRAESILYEGKTHTDLFVQDPMRGGNDKMFEDLVAIIHADDLPAQAKDAVAPPRKRLVPECMIQVARRVSPF